MFLIPKIVILKSVFPFLAFLIAWELVWKIVAMYKAGQQKELWWFICIFIFNTFGLLPIIYLLIDSMKKENIELSKENNNIFDETKQKKTLKGGVKKWENVMPTNRQKGVSNATTKKSIKEKKKPQSVKKK